MTSYSLVLTLRDSRQFSAELQIAPNVFGGRVVQQMVLLTYFTVVFRERASL